MSDFKLPDNYYDPPEERLYFVACLNPKCEWGEADKEQAPHVPEKCPECGGTEFETGRDWFHV